MSNPYHMLLPKLRMAEADIASKKKEIIQDIKRILDVPGNVTKFQNALTDRPPTLELDKGVKCQLVAKDADGEDGGKTAIILWVGKVLMCSVTRTNAFTLQTEWEIEIKDAYVMEIADAMPQLYYQLDQCGLLPDFALLLKHIPKDQ